MMRGLLISIVLGYLFAGEAAHSQNIWGAEAETGQLAGEFDGNFIETGFAGSYDANAWTALSVFDSNGGVMPGAAYFIKNSTGMSQGAFATGTPVLNSPSLNNGIAIFDSDFLDNTGNSGAMGLGTSPAPHRGELISPRIDLQNYIGQSLALKVYTTYRTFALNELSIAFSTDDGLTWSPSVSIADSFIPNDNSIDPFWLRMEIPDSVFEGLVNISQFRFKFIADMEYYYWSLDDVTIFVSDLIFKSDFD